MRIFKRFCFSYSIATGVAVIGYLNIVEFMWISAIYIVLEDYLALALLILPSLCFIVYLKSLKKDTSKKRRRHFII